MEVIVAAQALVICYPYYELDKRQQKEERKHL